MEYKIVKTPHHVEYVESRPYDGIFKYIQNQTKIGDIGSGGYIRAASLDSISESKSLIFLLITQNEENTYF